MRINVKNGRVEGYVDYDGYGETEVISINVVGGELKVGASICLPVRYTSAKLVLACMNETFIKAESLLDKK